MIRYREGLSASPEFLFENYLSYAMQQYLRDSFFPLSEAEYFFSPEFIPAEEADEIIKYKF